jgi:hypothetical protein
MSDSNILGVTTGRAVVGNNQRVGQAGLRDGTAYGMDWVTSKAIEGKLFTAQVGSFVTHTDFRATADLDQPESVIDVPLGTTIIPVHIRVFLEDCAGTDNSIIAAANPALCGAGTSTAGTIIAKRLNGSFASACKFYYTYSADCVDPANYDEFWRAGHPIAKTTDAAMYLYEWTSASAPVPVIVGPASLVLWIGSGAGGAPAGFSKISWAEFLSSEL